MILLLDHFIICYFKGMFNFVNYNVIFMVLKQTKHIQNCIEIKFKFKNITVQSFTVLIKKTRGGLSKFWNSHSTSLYYV